MDPVEKWLESQLQVAESEMSHTAIEHLTYVAAELYLAGIITDRKYPPRFHSRLFAVLMRMLSDINDYYEEGDSFRFGKECLVMIRNSQQLVTMVLNSFRHPHPRVRSAALTAIVRLSHDLNLQPRYYTRMLPALASAMDDFEYPKLQAHAASAVINFIKNYSTPDILTPYRDEIVSQLSVLLQSSNTWVQEAALTALASVADNSLQGQFQKYHDEVMPYLKAILVSKNDKASRMLRVYAKRCIDRFAVEKDKFRDAPKQAPGEKVIKTVKGYNLGKRKCQLSEPGSRPKKIAPSKCKYPVHKAVLIEPRIITDRKYPPRFHSRLFAVLMRMLSDINDYYEEGDSFRFGKECLVMIRNSQQLVTMVLNSFRHPHPRVRSAALTAIVRLSHDLNLQPRYYTRMLPALASAMDDFEYPKLQAHAASAVINFIKNYSTPDILTPYRDEIVSQLSVLLQSSNTWVQEAALTALASVADNSSQGQFQKYHDEVMPYLKAILVSKNDKASLMLRVSAKRCIDHFAVGKDKFRDAPKQFFCFRAGNFKMQIKPAGKKPMTLRSYSPSDDDFVEHAFTTKRTRSSSKADQPVSKMKTNM
ncbi:ran-binding protein 6 [Artemisia annua]|uniref:Ran-binding protein 6 n=1 Tax=Artemisia annua TaxID=35608 RepID=A0A2U1PJ72_ARTAN|nr:ran-binding protein 6 [Artemisia annua]